jgi:sortase A
MTNVDVDHPAVPPPGGLFRSSTLARLFCPEQGLVVVGLALVVWCLAASIDGWVYQALGNFELQLRQPGTLSSISPGTLSALRSLVRNGEPLGRLDIPRLGISAIISQGDDPGTLMRAIGHIPGTAFPGGEGNVGLAGHRDTFFRRLGEVRQGDWLRIATPSGIYDYIIEATAIVDPSRIAVLAPTNEPSATLVTCYPFQFIGAAPRRFVVRARQVESGTAWTRSAP